MFTTTPILPIPQNSLLNAPGATDLAIRNNVAYLNQATDLVALTFNFSNNSVEVTKRVANAFPELISPDGWYAYDVPENSVVVGWKLKN